MSVSVNPIDRNLFISGSCDMKVCLWDLRMKKCVNSFKGHHSHDINAVKFFPNGLGFVTGSEDLTCKLFDLRVERPLTTFSNDELNEPISSVCFSKSGRILFASHGPSIIAWDTLTGKMNCEIAKLNIKCSCLEVSPDGSALAAGSWDHFLRIFA